MPQPAPVFGAVALVCAALASLACSSAEASGALSCDAAQSCQAIAEEAAPVELTERELNETLDALESEIEEEP